MTGRSRGSAAAIALGLIAAAPATAQSPARPAAAPPAIKQGYWWYDAPKPAAPPEDPDALTKPVIPPMAELATWTPPKIRRLIEQQRDYAATVLTVDAVADFWRLQDFARRKARAFCRCDADCDASASRTQLQVSQSDGGRCALGVDGREGRDFAAPICVPMPVSSPS